MPLRINDKLTQLHSIHSGSGKHNRIIGMCQDIRGRRRMYRRKTLHQLSQYTGFPFSQQRYQQRATVQEKRAAHGHPPLAAYRMPGDRIRSALH